MISTAIINNELIIRLGFFIGVLSLMALWELLVPYRVLTASKPRRWLYNLSMVGIDTIVVRLIFPAAAVGIAIIAAERQWGLFNNIEAPVWLSTIAVVILMDLIIYFQHVMFHAIPTLWRLHMVHHTDLDIDVTTGNRFHPVEIIISMLIKMAAVILVGPTVVAVIIFEVLLNATSMFNHSNIRLPKTLDRLLRLVIVTPDMHRVHHSAIKRETNSNYGFNLPWWDRVFGTYRNQPEAGHVNMVIGLEQYRDERQLTLGKLLLLPVTGALGEYPINRDKKEKGI
jgi:sterol desaturase/sphingolipid hydroxylase (fatty acid hydroxylase superfamily)